ARSLLGTSSSSDLRDGPRDLSRLSDPSVRQAQPSNSLTRKEKRTELDAQLPTAPRGVKPLPPHGAAWGAKQAGEADRVLLRGRKSAEPAKAGREGTSDPEPARPASPPWRGKPNRWPKPRQDASHRLGSG